MTRKSKIGLIFLFVILIGLIVPQRFSMPVVGATKADYNKDTFWYYPWGRSVTHKGVDIFAKEGTNLVSSTVGIVLFSGETEIGGKIIVILGPKWRFHYYAHLKELKTSPFTLISKKEIIGTVGASGNAVGKPAHLHYSIMTPIPYFWRIDSDKQGWKKMFYLNPLDYLPKD